MCASPTTGGTSAMRSRRCRRRTDLTSRRQAGDNREDRARSHDRAVLGLASAAAQTSAPAPTATAAPDFSGIWNRVGNLWLDPIPDDDGGKPVQRLKVD